MPSLNYLPRRKEPKAPIETVEQRVDRVITMIRIKGEISTYNLQKIMQWGPGTHQRIILIIKDNYQKDVEWNKKTRMLKYIGTLDTPALEIPITEKPKLSTEELKLINVIKQESQN